VHALPLLPRHGVLRISLTIAAPCVHQVCPDCRRRGLIVPAARVRALPPEMYAAFSNSNEGGLWNKTPPLAGPHVLPTLPRYRVVNQTRKCTGGARHRPGRSAPPCGTPPSPSPPRPLGTPRTPSLLTPPLRDPPLALPCLLPRDPTHTLPFSPSSGRHPRPPSSPPRAPLCHVAVRLVIFEHPPPETSSFAWAALPSTYMPLSRPRTPLLLTAPPHHASARLPPSAAGSRANRSTCTSPRAPSSPLPFLSALAAPSRPRVPHRRWPPLSSAHAPPPPPPPHPRPTPSTCSRRRASHRRSHRRVSPSPPRRPRNNNHHHHHSSPPPTSQSRPCASSTCRRRRASSLP
jgi:hypothetical protein